MSTHHHSIGKGEHSPTFTVTVDEQLHPLPQQADDHSSSGGAAANDAATTAFPVFRNQVAGHTPLLWHKGSICKPLNPTEYSFYANLLQGELSALVPFAPKFYGLLDLNSIPLEFQMQQEQEKESRRAEKRLVLRERERRDLEAKAAALAHKVAAASTATTPATPSTRQVPALLSPGRSSPRALATATTGPNAEAAPPLAASSVASPSTAATATPAPAASSPSSPGGSRGCEPTTNSWVFTCLNRKKAPKYHTASPAFVSPPPPAAAAPSLTTTHEQPTSTEPKAHTLPASFTLSPPSKPLAEVFAAEAERLDDEPPASPADPNSLAPPSPSADPTAPDTGSAPAEVQYIVLEDLTFAYDRPCILDLKLGTRQHGIRDSAKKVASKRAKCAQTTSGKLGIRLCGMQVYHPRRKPHMPSIEESPPSDAAAASAASANPPASQDGKYIFWDKYYGRSLTEESLLKTLKLFFWNGEKLLLHVILLFLERLDKLRATLELRQMGPYRFYSSSLLMVYEGQCATADAPPTSDSPVVASPRPDHYPALSSLSSSNRLHDIVDRSLGLAPPPNTMPRSRSIDFHQMHRPLDPAATITPPRNATKDTLSLAMRSAERSHLHVLRPSSTTPLSGTTGSHSSGQSHPPASPASSAAPHLDAEDLLELTQILAREAARIAAIRRAHAPIVAQKLSEEQADERKLRRLAGERAASAPLTRGSASPELEPLSPSSPSFDVRERGVSTSAGSDSSIGTGLSTPGIGAFSPTEHISCVRVSGSGVGASGPHFKGHAPPTATAARATGGLPLALDASPQPPSPLPVPAMGDGHACHSAHLSTYSSTPARTMSSPLALATAVPLVTPAPKFYRSARKTTHAQARERARLKGNIDIRLIDYAQVVRLSPDGEERPIVDDAGQACPGGVCAPCTPTRNNGGNEAEHHSEGVGDPGLLLGVNNLIYFISSIVSQEIESLLAAERLRTGSLEEDTPIAHDDDLTPVDTDEGPSVAVHSPSRTRTPPLDPSSVPSIARSGPDCREVASLSSHTATFASAHVPLPRQLQMQAQTAAATQT